MIASIQAGLSALRALGKKMEVKANNIANANTSGFKADTSTISELPAQAVSTLSGTAQVGRGAALEGIAPLFEQGPIEPSGEPTNMAIGGDGFFVLRERGSGRLFYGRAGNFRFDRDGYLTNPEGYVVQGWRLDEEGEETGSLGDIRLTSRSSPPSPTSRIWMITNLDADASAHGGALKTAWDGSATSGSPMPDDAYEYRSTVKVYDTLGGTHDITVYFDKTSPSQWEYVITCNPSEDGRTGAAGSPCAGLLAKGTITFGEGSGTITPVGGMTMETFNGTDWTDPANSANWTSASLDSSGYPEFTVEFQGTAGSSMSIALDLGTRSQDGSWVNDSLTTTQFSNPSATTYQAADGYGAGSLLGMEVDENGTLIGKYSNGEIIPLFRTALAGFQNPQGLRKEGGNLYRETRESGEALTARPGTNGFGLISPSSLEQSNVELAKEITDTIPLQRGYEANIKTIKTQDEMLGTILDILG
ncbi:MAG: flagellar hook protein FlgE [Deltaproteobacteria bacterium]|nr:flagellar hook protein FlgE [Deltaproteobacteria bacterium]